MFSTKKKRKNKKQVKTNYNNSYYVYHMNSLKIPKSQLKKDIQYNGKRKETKRQDKRSTLTSH